MKFVLSQDWLVGHHQIDKEHQQIISLLNELSDLVEEEDALGFCEKTREMLSLLKSHFRNEAAIMLDYGYSSRSEHISCHADQIEQVTQLGCVQHSDDLRARLGQLVDVVFKKVLLEDLHFRDHLITIGKSRLP